MASSSLAFSIRTIKVKSTHITYIQIKPICRSFTQSFKPHNIVQHATELAKTPAIYSNCRTESYLYITLCVHLYGFRMVRFIVINGCRVCRPTTPSTVSKDTQWRRPTMDHTRLQSDGPTDTSTQRVCWIRSFAPNTHASLN